MLNQKSLDFKATSAWPSFVSTYQLSEQQQQKFQQYGQLLLQENAKYNITAIQSPEEIVADHFYDSLALLKNYTMDQVCSIVDVGSGGGFPGIPLAIMCPGIQFNLVEVNLKKVYFLNLVTQKIGLTNVQVHTDDWRTFLRKFDKPVDIFVARASLPVEELLRIFKPSSRYTKSLFIYWASKKWIPNLSEKEYLDNCLTYMVGKNNVNYVFSNILHNKYIF